MHQLNLFIFYFYFLHHYRCPHSTPSLPTWSSPTLVPPALWPSPHYCLHLWVKLICSLTDPLPFLIWSTHPRLLWQLSGNSMCSCLCFYLGCQFILKSKCIFSESLQFNDKYFWENNKIQFNSFFICVITPILKNRLSVFVNMIY